MKGHYTDSLSQRAAESIFRHPLVTLVAAGSLSLFAASQLSNGESADTAPTTTTAPQQAAIRTEQTSEYSIETASGALVDITCEGSAVVTVQEGQTLTELAVDIDSTRLGLNLPELSVMGKVAVLAEANGIEDPDVIFAGDAVTVPADCAVLDISIG